MIRGAHTSGRITGMRPGRWVLDLERKREIYRDNDGGSASVSRFFPSVPWRMHVDTLNIAMGVMEFLDEMTDPPFHGALDNVSLTLGPIVIENTASVTPDASSTISIIGAKTLEVKNSATIGANTFLYARDDVATFDNTCTLSGSRALSKSGDMTLKSSISVTNGSIFYSSQDIIIEGNSNTLSLY